MIFMFTVGSFGIAFLLACGLNWLGLIPWRRASEAHWTERARLLFPVRISAAINVWVIAANVAVGLQMFRSDAALAWLGPAFAAWCGAALSGYMLDREIWPGLSLIRWFGQFLIYGMFWQAGLLLMISGSLLMPPNFGWQSWTVAGVLLALILSLIFGLALTVLRWTRLVQPASPRVRDIAFQTAQQAGANLRAVWVDEGPAAHAFALLPMKDMLFSESLLRRLSDNELASICAHEAAHLIESKWVFAGRVLGAMALYPLVFICPVSHQFGLSGVLVLFVAGVLLISLPRKLAQKMEKRADAAAVRQTADPVIYAHALEKLYETNQMPAVMPKKNRLIHADLYDRMVAAGVTPGYERPKPSPRTSWTTYPLAVLLGLQLGIMISRAQDANEQEAARKGSSPPSLSQQSPEWPLLSSEVSTNNPNTNAPRR
jgi:Zn-dependent protease with chaperone function